MSETMTKTDAPLRRLAQRLGHRRDALPADRPNERQLWDELTQLLPEDEQIRSLSSEDQEALRLELERFCFVHGWDEVLRESGIVHPYRYREGFPQQPPDAPLEVPLAEFPGSWSLLGHEIGFPIGIPASVLTSTAKWIDYFAKHGFNVFTYKTVRSRRTTAHAFPNWVFLEGPAEPLPVDRVDLDPAATVVQGNRDTYMQRLRAFSTANSFGVPSEDPSIWREDVENALSLLDDGKLLILSVMGAAEEGDSLAVQRDDFVAVAREALRTKAPAIELNLSCPNTANATARDGIAPPLCMDIDATVEVVEAVAEEVGGAVPLVAKLSYLPFDRLEPLVGRIAPFVAAISGINTLQVQVEDEAGQSTFPDRRSAGMSGIAIRDLGLDFVKSLQRIANENEALEFELIGMGGVMTTEDVDALLLAGADAVQTATAASVNPYLVRELLVTRSDRRPQDEERLAELRALLYAPDGGLRDTHQLAAHLGVEEEEVERELAPSRELDLPRRFFELVAYLERPTESATQSEIPRAWGKAPSPRRAKKAVRRERKLLRAQTKALLEDSLPVAELAAQIHSETADLVARSSDGNLISFEFKGERRLPRWQLRDEGDDLLPGLKQLGEAFGDDALAVSEWVLAPNAQLGGCVPRELLQRGEVDQVLAALSKLGAASF
jgi:dihydroorotate dehydrogenase